MAVWLRSDVKLHRDEPALELGGLAGAASSNCGDADHTTLLNTSERVPAFSILTELAFGVIAFLVMLRLLLPRPSPSLGAAITHSERAALLYV